MVDSKSVQIKDSSKPAFLSHLLEKRLSCAYANFLNWKSDIFPLFWVDGSYDCLRFDHTQENSTIVKEMNFGRKMLFCAIAPSERRSVLKVGLPFLFTLKPPRSCREHFLCRQRVCLKGFLCRKRRKVKSFFFNFLTYVT